MLLRAALALGAALLAPVAARAQDGVTPPTTPQSIVDRCSAGTCKARLTPEQLLGEAQALILARRFDEARPMVIALSTLPHLKFETRFLSAMLLGGTGDHNGAAEAYKAILADHPGQTRVRLELAREMLAMGKATSADRQFRIAQQDEDLPDDVARTIRAVRDVIRARRAWRLNFDLGIAPDSNINNATAADTVTILWGTTPLPVTLDERAKARSGVGQTASISGGLRLPVADRVSALVDIDAGGNNYSGSDYDDYQTQVAAGAEARITPALSVSAQAVGAQRWYGGGLASRQGGIKTGVQAQFGTGAQAGFQIDARRTDARFDDAYDGWQVGAYATIERAVSRTIVASAGAFARRDWLAAKAYSSNELGVIAGVGGELPLGITVGVSGSVSRARFDAPIPLFSLEPRQDWRYTARATLGNRKVALLGFSPQVSASYSRIDSSIPYYANDRLRFRFSVARYF